MALLISTVANYREEPSHPAPPHLSPPPLNQTTSPPLRSQATFGCSPPINKITCISFFRCCSKQPVGKDAINILHDEEMKLISSIIRYCESPTTSLIHNPQRTTVTRTFDITVNFVLFFLFFFPQTCICHIQIRTIHHRSHVTFDLTSVQVSESNTGILSGAKVPLTTNEHEWPSNVPKWQIITFKHRADPLISMRFNIFNEKIPLSFLALQIQRRDIVYLHCQSTAGKTVDAVFIFIVNFLLTFTLDVVQTG